MLFERDCVPLSEAARQSSAVFAGVGTLVLLSIQQPWYGMPREYADVCLNGSKSIYLFGAKRIGFEYICTYADELRDAARKAFDANDLDGLIYRYLDVPNLGLTKASFLAQMTLGDGACLDVHNLRRFGLNPRLCVMAKTVKPSTKLARIATYNSAWRALGTSAKFWDDWCNHLVETPYQRFNDAGEVSAQHLLPLHQPLAYHELI